jgi:photosystem II stability/assembly factor-like uncharacterized protein
MLVAGLHEAYVSTDEAASWKKLSLPAELTQIGAVAADDQGGLWIGGFQGAYESRDLGGHWEKLKNLTVVDVNSLTFDAAQKVLYITSNSEAVAFVVHVPQQTVSLWETGWRLRFVRRAGDHILGATIYDGIVLQPRMVDSPITH